MITKKDYFIGALVGLCTGILVLFIFGRLAINFPYQHAVLLIGIPVLWALGVWLGKFLSQWFSFFAQFGKFATVGFLSSAIDFAILNIVSAATGITAGLVIGWVNIPGFLVATINGYLWNKLWVFSSAKEGLFKDFPKFLMVTIIGLLINSGIIILLTTHITPPLALDAQRWLNVAKIAATTVALIWNFIGYKLIAFRQSHGTK